jgi:hypothetical protein
MGATGIATDAMKTILSNAYTGAGLYITLLKALKLQAATIANAATFSVDLTVQAGDVLVLDQGLSTQEQVTVQSVSGAGPYTVTPVTRLVFAHAINANISHVPLNSTTVHEIGSITRVAASWGAQSPAGTVVSAAASITVPSGNIVGSLALFSASTAGTYYDATPVQALDFTSASGGYQPIWTETGS